MNYDGIEKKILERMNITLVARKSELVKVLDGQVKNSNNTVNIVTKSLMQKGMITSVYGPEPTFAITQKGMRESNI